MDLFSILLHRTTAASISLAMVYVIYYMRFAGFELELVKDFIIICDLIFSIQLYKNPKIIIVYTLYFISK